ncbi:MAG: DUF2784 domain-containing protein, partial [Deltaproteobacteria bacterium]|nr:DUF2784 domain-containing protein [Deltaproteobacteria bacterium]
ATDIFFSLLHGCLVLFNLTGWIFKLTRRLHLITTGLTVLSWFGLGIYYGWGFCPCTQWHWQIKLRLGISDLPYSYVKYYADRLTGFSWDPAIVDGMVIGLGLLAFGLSCWLNWRDHRNRFLIQDHKMPQR